MSRDLHCRKESRTSSSTIDWSCSQLLHPAHSSQAKTLTFDPQTRINPQEQDASEVRRCSANMLFTFVLYASVQSSECGSYVCRWACLRSTQRSQSPCHWRPRPSSCGALSPTQIAEPPLWTCSPTSSSPSPAARRKARAASRVGLAQFRSTAKKSLVGVFFVYLACWSPCLVPQILRQAIVESKATEG